MVHTIDATARRRDLAEAVWRIVQCDGLAAASVRSVARETGLSTGSVRHFFGTQQELVTFAMQELLDTVGERMRSHVESVEPVDRVERAVRVLGEMMPLSDDSHAEGFAFFQFVMQARFDPALAPIATESFHRIHQVCADVVASLGELPEAETARHARLVWAVVDGLTTQLLFAPDLVSRAAARTTLRDLVERITTS